MSDFDYGHFSALLETAYNIDQQYQVLNDKLGDLEDCLKNFKGTVTEIDKCKLAVTDAKQILEATSLSLLDSLRNIM